MRNAANWRARSKAALPLRDGGVTIRFLVLLVRGHISGSVVPPELVFSSGMVVRLVMARLVGHAVRPCCGTLVETVAGLITFAAMPPVDGVATLGATEEGSRTKYRPRGNLEFLTL